MENKYYTPGISEYHYGFQYERLKNGIWVNTCSNLEGPFNGDGSQPFDLHKDEFRVKYLDKEDIERLGWKYYKTHPGMEQMEFERGEYNLTYDPEFRGRHWLRIATDGEGDVTIFNGDIKNKSELKKLMQQLEIQ